MSRRTDDEITLVLTREELEDVLSAVSWVASAYPREGAVEFRAALKKLTAKLWRVIKGH